MPGLKQHMPDFQFSGNRVTPDEIDRYDRYYVINPSVDPQWFGTTAVGTSTQAKPLVVINALADYPRNLLGAVSGSAGLGGTWVVNGKNQFGVSQSESLAIGSAVNGGTTAGTKVFASVSSGTFTFRTSAAGSGTPTLGVAVTAAGVLLGLPDQIKSTADVKAITWSKAGTSTTLNGGTIGGYVSVANSSFRGTADIAVTDVYSVLYRSTYDRQGTVNQAAL